MVELNNFLDFVF